MAQRGEGLVRTPKSSFQKKFSQALLTKWFFLLILARDECSCLDEWDEEAGNDSGEASRNSQSELSETDISADAMCCGECWTRDELDCSNGACRLWFESGGV